MVSANDLSHSARLGATSSVSGRLWLGLGVWLATALILAAIGFLDQLPVTAIPLCIWTPVLLLALAIWRSPSLRRAVNAVPLHALVGFHSVRAVVGAAFLFYEAHGLLTPAFALPAGIGDVAVGLSSLPIAWLAARRGAEAARRAVFAWNLCGLIDILLVFVTAQRILLFGEGPTAMRAFFLFPNPTIPLFLVPMVLLTHALIALRTRRAHS